MQRGKKAWAAALVPMMAAGGVVGRLHLIGPNPGTFFALGVFATLAVAGIAFGIWDARRIIRSGAYIGN